MTDVELDERVTTLEENGGGAQNGKGNLCNMQFYMLVLST